MASFEEGFLKGVPRISFDDFELKKLVGRGGFGTVFLAENKINGSVVAMKFFGYESHRPIKEDILHEIQLNMKLADVEGIAQMHGIFFDTEEGLLTELYRPRSYFDVEDPFPVIVIEALLGESLLYRIITHRDITEQLLVDLFKSFIKSLLSIHRKGLIHRDIKLDNIMLQTVEADSDMKIVDFGMMVEIGEDGVYTDTHIAGTPGYHAPESLTRKEYSRKSDVWQSGIVLYIMLTGRAPFLPDDKDAILQGRYISSGDVFEQCPVMAKDLIARMLTVDPADRITLSEVLSHPWLTEPASQVSFTPEYQQRIKNLMCYSKLRDGFLGYNIQNRSVLCGSSNSIQAKANELPEEFEQHLFHLKKKVISRMFPLVEKIQPVKEGGGESKERSTDEHKKSREGKNRFSMRLTLEPTTLDFDAFAALCKESDLDVLLVPGLFDVFDVNHDGSVDLKEFLVAILTLRQIQEEGDGGDVVDPAELYFNLFDLDGDGFLSYEEFQWMVVCLLHDEKEEGRRSTGISRLVVDEAFFCMDDNRDQHVDFAEFKKFYHSLVYNDVYTTESGNAEELLAFSSAGNSLFSSNGSSRLFTPSRVQSGPISWSTGDGNSPSKAKVEAVRQFTFTEEGSDNRVEAFTEAVSAGKRSYSADDGVDDSKCVVM